MSSVQIHGRTVFNNSDINEPDIDGGTADDLEIGAGTPAPGTFSTLKADTDPVDEHGVGDRGYNDLRYVPKDLDATTSSDPAVNAAVTTTIINAYGGVIISLTLAGNAQTLQNPTDTAAIKRFIVVTDDGNGANTIEVNGITMSAGEAQWFIWDGSAWVAVTAVDADDIAFTPSGSVVATNVQTAIEEVDTEKLAKASNLSDVVDAVASFGNIKQVATELATGVIEKATTAECVTGIDTDGAVTPAGLTARMEEPGEIGGTTPAAGNFTTGDFSGAVNVDGPLTAINQGWYGVKWPGVTSACVRTGALEGVAASSSPGNALLPAQSTMRRCVVDDNGQVVYYLDPTNSFNRLGFTPSITGQDDAGAASKVSDAGLFTLDESAYVGKYIHNITDSTYSPITAKDSDNVLSIADNIMASGEDFEVCTAGVAYGGDGQVLDQIAAFWYRFSIDGDGYPNWDVSTAPFDGASIHPMFFKNGEFVQYRYCSAFEGSMYDASATDMVAPASIVTSMYAHGDKMCSLAGEFPKTNETRDEFRRMAAQRGMGWRQYDYDLMSGIQLLFLTEYADFNSQSMIGMGRTELSGGTWVADSYIGKCGKSLGDGNGTNSVGGNTNAAYMTYRGIENFFGNIWKWLDGININGYIPYISNTDSDFQDDTALNYTDLSVTMPATANYQQTLLSQGRGFLPATVGADTGKVTDFYWGSTGWRVIFSGGSVTYTGRAGVFAFRADFSSTYIGADITARLAF